MERASAAAVGMGTPITDSATFVITLLDVGSRAVRPGVMGDIELERAALLIAAKAVLRHIREGKVAIGAVQEMALETAVRIAEKRL